MTWAIGKDSADAAKWAAVSAVMKVEVAQKPHLYSSSHPNSKKLAPVSLHISLAHSLYELPSSRSRLYLILWQRGFSFLFISPLRTCWLGYRVTISLLTHQPTFTSDNQTEIQILEHSWKAFFSFLSLPMYSCLSSNCSWTCRFLCCL